MLNVIEFTRVACREQSLQTVDPTKKPTSDAPQTACERDFGRLITHRCGDLLLVVRIDAEVFLRCFFGGVSSHIGGTEGQQAGRPSTAQSPSCLSNECQARPCNHQGRSDERCSGIRHCVYLAVS